MNLIIIGIVGAVALLASVAGAYKTGETNGMNARDLHWKTAIAEANRKVDEAISVANTTIRKKDLEASELLASKERELKDIENALEDAKKVQPLSVDCTKCLIPRTHVERVRQGTTGSPDQSRKP